MYNFLPLHIFGKIGENFLPCTKNTIRYLSNLNAHKFPPSLLALYLR